MSSGIKLRQVFVWIAVMGILALLALGQVWQKNTHAGLSRSLVKTARERDALAAEVLLLETQTRGLRQYSRLEDVARERLGLIKPGPAVVIQPDGQLVAAAGPEEATAPEGSGSLRMARLKGLFR